MTGENRYETHDGFDVVVIGAGGAGLRAAIEASAAGARTAIVCKSLLGKAHTVMAEGGMAAALANVDTRDSWEAHFRDTMKGGKFLSHWRMAEIHAREAPERVRELERWGAVFDRTRDSRILQRNFGGHTYPRLAHVGDRTGLEMIRTLQDRSVHKGIDVFMECTIRSIVKSEEDGRVAGCVGYRRESGRTIVFHAPAVVLATGGTGKCWEITSGSWEYTGDGHALALWAGADLQDMEFIQFHPTGMVWPPSVRGILITEGVRGEGGVLKNARGERFMFDHIPEMFKGDYAETPEEARAWLEDTILNRPTDHRRPPELLTRDVVARAIRAQVREGLGSPHGGVFLDVASQRTPDEIRRKLPSMYHQLKELGDVDITLEPMEVGPTSHYTMGGVRVDPETQASTVPGLFAAGEVASGMHGANRLGGNSLSDLLVFGKRAGEFAAGYARSAPRPPLDAAEVEAAVKAMHRPFENEGGENPFVVHDELRRLMQSNVGIVRTGPELEAAIGKITDLRERARKVSVTGNISFNPGWHLALDLENMLEVGEMVARSALRREESRGGHTREDFPDSDPDRWARVNVVVRRDGATLAVREAPLPEVPPELEKILRESE